MTSRHAIDLAVRRGELKAKIEMQRKEMALHAEPLAHALGLADRAAEGVDWLKRHPGAVGAAVAGVIIVRPGRAWRWARRGIAIWQSLKLLKSRIPPGLL